MWLYSHTLVGSCIAMVSYAASNINQTNKLNISKRKRFLKVQPNYPPNPKELHDIDIPDFLKTGVRHTRKSEYVKYNKAPPPFFFTV
ncbi:hypothetical protein BpHYR1_025725 [Brachionus plicatilis]|uniref:39S ribosomal mitochondrial n=1 Tax=Brachionus plicatilis TaxID=10195 RepID=A0A3M7SJW5_BRAPC|nr:hypothetical protein BpHYR1_025725 [Brachionus plicatilis]